MESFEKTCFRSVMPLSIMQIPIVLTHARKHDWEIVTVLYAGMCPIPGTQLSVQPQLMPVYAAIICKEYHGDTEPSCPDFNEALRG